MKKLLLLASALGALVVTAGAGTAAHAQSIDYASLESLFGEPITTSATGTPLKASETPSNMTIITADEIRQSGSRKIPEILARVPGLDILQTGFNNFDVGVRGYQQPFQPRLLVLVDGRQVFLDDYSRTAWDNIPVNVDDIRQIEVVKGASSALFGSNAAGGVINIVTNSPLYDNSNVATLSGGTQNSITGDATATVNGSWGGSKFTAGGLNADEFNTGRYPLDQPAIEPRHRYIANSSVFQVTPNLQGFTEATYSESQSNAGDPTDGSLMGAQKVRTYSVRGGANWQTPYGLITSNNYLNHSFISITEPTDGGAPYTFATNLIDSQLQDQFKIGADHTFRAGLEYKHKTFRMSGAQINEPASPALTENNYAIGGTWMWQIDNKLSWTNAARYDRLDMAETGTLMTDSYNKEADYSHIINTWSANSDIIYKLTYKDTFRLGYGRGVQLPSLINSGYGLYQNFGPTPSDWEGNPRLKPTIVQDYSVDYTRKVPEIFSFAKITPFYEVNQDIVSPLTQVGTIATGDIFGESINVGNSRGYGVELQIKGSHPLGFRWDASYSFTRIIDSQGVLDNVNYQESAPQHHYRLLVGYTEDPWEIDANGQLLSSTNMLRSADGGQTWSNMPADGYATFGGRLGYKITENITAAVSGLNLNRRVIGTSPYPAIERQGFMTLTGRF
jgi:outer membrane receptor for ferrienterochelin and colicins